MKTKRKEVPFKPLTIATIFSYSANQAIPNEDLNGLIHEEAAEVPSQISQSNRDKLDRYIAKYNQRFKTQLQLRWPVLRLLPRCADASQEKTDRHSTGGKYFPDWLWLQASKYAYMSIKI